MGERRRRSVGYAGSEQGPRRVGPVVKPRHAADLVRPAAADAMSGRPAPPFSNSLVNDCRRPPREHVGDGGFVFMMSLRRWARSALLKPPCGGPGPGHRRRMKRRGPLVRSPAFVAASNGDRGLPPTAAGQGEPAGKPDERKRRRLWEQGAGVGTRRGSSGVGERGPVGRGVRVGEAGAVVGLAVQRRPKAGLNAKVLVPQLAASMIVVPASTGPPGRSCSTCSPPRRRGPVPSMIMSGTVASVELNSKSGLNP